MKTDKAKRILKNMSDLDEEQKEVLDLLFHAIDHLYRAYNDAHTTIFNIRGCTHDSSGMSHPVAYRLAGKWWKEYKTLIYDENYKP